MIGELQRLKRNYPAPSFGPFNAATSQDGWAVGGAATMFSSCSNDCRGPNSGFFEEPGSLHPGGCYIGLVDGSVRFINENMELLLLRDLGSKKAGDGPANF
jgi:hypothetical protein